MKKFNIEDQLHAIDQKLQYKEQKEIYMIYIMIFAALFAFSYLLFWDTSLQMFESKLKQRDKLKQKITMDEIYLKSNPPSIITMIDQKIKKTQEEVIKYKDYNQYIKTKIEQISYLLYDERVWGEYLHSIDRKAARYKVKLLELENKVNDTGESFGHVLDISLKSQGKYKNLLKFINALEKSDLVVDIHDLNVETNSTLLSDINISVWGIKY